MTKAKSKI